MNPPSFRPNLRGTEFKSLHRKLERALAHIGRIDDESEMLETILEHLCREFEDDLGFEGGRIYAREGDDYVLRTGFGTSRDAPRGLRVPREYPPHRRLLADGMVLMTRGEPGVDEGFEEAIGVGSTFAAIGVGEGNSQIIAFSVKGEPRKEDVLFSLSLVRHVINLKLRQQHMAGIIDAARILHEGILPRVPPALDGFEIAAVSRPADSVSGDLFDYLPISDCCLGIAIADSSGHGLPAALLARDVITALRMGAGQGLDVASIVERVNRVICRAALSGTFVSLFYGQLRGDGTLEYCNAGHEPPLLIGAGNLRRLGQGGTVLGPIPTASYEVGEARLEPGDMLVLYTDGIVERENPSGDLYGPERLEHLLPTLRDRSPELVAASILADVDRFAVGRPAQDDMTMVVVRRLPVIA
jgi:serine phosphatase RsbU (regulator of sigma subunit)